MTVRRDTGISEAAVVHPGETLVVRVNPAVDPEDLTFMRDSLKEHLPEGVDLLMLACEQIAVCRCSND